MTLTKTQFESVYTSKFNSMKNRHHYNLMSRLKYDTDRHRYVNYETQKAWEWFQQGKSCGEQHNV